MKHAPAPIEVTLLELFVQGQSAHSNEALDVVRRVCEERLRGRYRLEVIDIHHEPERTRMAGVIAAPVLIRRRPEPVLRTVGQFSEARVLEGLGFTGAPDNSARS